MTSLVHFALYIYLQAHAPLDLTYDLQLHDIAPHQLGDVCTDGNYQTIEPLSHVPKHV